jgi:hypothetical protein
MFDCNKGADVRVRSCLIMSGYAHAVYLCLVLTYPLMCSYVQVLEAWQRWHCGASHCFNLSFEAFGKAL